MSDLSRVSVALNDWLLAAESENEVASASLLVEFVAREQERSNEISRLREDNASLKRKMAYLSKRERKRLKGLIEVMSR